jgi:predicted enzyme related to lactoylglutathione lyase
MLKAIHFDLSADEPERAARFYREVFGWKIEKWEGPTDYLLIQTGDEKEPGITGGVAARVKPTDTAAVIVDVPSVDEFAEKVKASGGEIRESKQAIPGVGYLIMCIDSERNTFGIMQIDESAK